MISIPTSCSFRSRQRIEGIMQGTYPAKLAQDAIVEAACEIRFDSDMSGVSSLLLGVLYQNLVGKDKRIEALPMGQLPQPVLALDPNLQFAPTHRLQVDGQFIAVGDRVLGIGCTPYVGWGNFKKQILGIWDIVASKAPFISKIKRFSLKYVNIMTEVNQETCSELTHASIRLSEEQERMWPFQVRAEFKSNAYVDVVQLVSDATARLPSGEKSGFLVDIDIICLDPPEALLTSGEANLEEAHARAKSRFFGLLKESVVKARGAIYE